MGTASNRYGLVAKRYATAFLDMAAEAGLVVQVERDINELAAMLASSRDLRTLVTNPLIGRRQQKTAAMALAQKANFQGLTANFLGVLADNRRLEALESVIAAFREELRARRGEVEAKVQSAFALTPAQTKALQEQLSKAMGTNVTLNVEVKKELLGGMVVTVGSRMIDDSVSRKLEKLQRAMSEKAA